jgi:hypothetical protein
MRLEFPTENASIQKQKGEKMQNKRSPTETATLRLILAVVIAVGVFTTAANAQPSFAGNFTLPYEVHWGQAILPAGEYLIRMDSITSAAVIRSKSGSMAVFTEFPTLADSSEPGRFLTITRNGNEHRVRTLNLPELGKVVIFAPFTKNEKEALAKAGDIKTLPVVSAKK